MRRWWDESYARAEPGCDALRSDEHGVGPAGSDDSGLREANIASDAAAASDRTGADGIAAHYRFFVASGRIGDHRAGTLAAGRLDRAYEARGEFDAMLRWATEATRWRRSYEADNRHRHAKRLRELECALLPALKHLNNPAAYVHVGKAHRRAERLSEATVVYLRGRADFPESPALLNALAGALREAGEAPLARAQVARSLELDPSIESNRAAHTVAGFPLCDQREVAQALELGLRLAAAHPTDSRVYGLLVYANLIAGHAEEAARFAVLAQHYAKDDFDVVPWLCRLRTSNREARDFAVVRALDTVIDHVKRLRGQEIWEGSLGVHLAD